MLLMARLANLWLPLAFAAAIALAAASACGGGDDGNEAPVVTPQTPEVSLPTPNTDQTGAGEIEAAAAADRSLPPAAPLESSEGVQWSDGSLGCPQEGYAYAQVITPGYKLVFDLVGTPYSVHTNADGSHMVVCEDSR